MTVHSQGSRAWEIVCDGFDSDSFQKCESSITVSKLEYTLAQAMRDGAPSWKTDPILGKHYCGEHEIV